MIEEEVKEGALLWLLRWEGSMASPTVMFLAFWINSLRNCCLCERDDLSQRDSTPLSSASERTGAMLRQDPP